MNIKGPLDSWAEGQLRFYRDYLSKLKSGHTVTGERQPGSSEIIFTTGETIKVVEAQIEQLESYFAGHLDTPPLPSPDVV